MSLIKSLFPILKLAKVAAVIPMIGLTTISANAQEYTIGIVPQFEARKLADTWAPIIAKIEEKTGITLKMVGSPKIPDFEASFERGEYDFAYMNPYHAVVANNSQGYDPIARDGSRDLFGVLVVAKDSPYQTTADLDGKKIAFPAPNALGASLLMRAELTRKATIAFEPVYVSTHSSAYLNAVLGETAAAGGIMSTLKQQPEDVQNALRIIYETSRVPPHPIVVHPRVPKEIRDKIQAALMEIGETEEGKALLAEVPIGKIVPATYSDYKGLVELDLEKFFVKSAN